MNEKTLVEILQMSGYAGYVWTAFGVTIFILIALYIQTKLRLKKALHQYEVLSSQKGVKINSN